jgi:protein O-mannosyl-transferase
VFDDRDTVLLNRSLIAPWDWRAVLVHNIARPVVTLSYAFDRAVWGFTSFGYHITNVVLHITAVGLFYGWCTRALGDLSQREGKRVSGRDLTPEWPAFFAAAVFALHPVMSSAVVYISARSELLCAAGVFTAMTFARRAVVRRSRTAGILAALFGALALASSSSAAALPLLALAYDAWVLRLPGWRVRAARWYAPATLAVFIAVSWHLTGIMAAPVPPRGFFDNLLTQGIVIWRYAALLVVPYPQAIVHDVRWVTSPFDAAGLAALTALVALAAALAAAIRVRHTHPLVAFGLVWFVAVLAPTAIVPVRDPMVEHRLYLAGSALFLAGASVLFVPLARRRAARVALTALLAVLAVQTYTRSVLWSDPMKLWAEAVAVSPGAWQAHLGYAELLREVGSCDRAAPEYEAALRMNPTHVIARAGLDACRSGR